MWKKAIVAKFKLLCLHINEGNEKNYKNYCRDKEVTGTALKREPL
jgi:hypothetical protein